MLLTRPEDFDRWMHGLPKAAMELAREYPPEQMQIVQTGYEKEAIGSAGALTGTRAIDRH